MSSSGFTVIKGDFGILANTFPDVYLDRQAPPQATLNYQRKRAEQAPNQSTEFSGKLAA